jgi:formylmethanofuran dehydrogenase subunit C
VSEVVTLTLRAPLTATVDAAAIAPDRLALLGEREIAAIPLWVGARTVPLGELFAVAGGNSAQLRVVGATRHLAGLGSGMAGGVLTVDGDAGAATGAGMTGGTIDVLGSVGDGAGAAMAGGTLRVAGDAGDRLGASAPGASRGMTGGEIVVRGSAGAEAASRARRGLVAVMGDAGERGAHAMIAGSLVVLGRAGAGTGEGSKRGSVVAVGGVDVPATYAYACTYRPPHVRLTLTYLRRHYMLPIAESAVGGLYQRFCGDAGDVGKGEILQWTAE